MTTPKSETASRATLIHLSWSFLLLTGCSSAVLSPESYMTWMADPKNGLVQEKRFEEVGLRLEYNTPEQLTLQDLGPDASMPAIIGAIEEREGAHYFNLQFRALKNNDVLMAGSKDQDDYYKRQYYFGSLVQDDLMLVIGNDTLPCALTHFERTYGAAPFNNLLVSFIDGQQDTLDQDIRFIYNDRAFGLGPVEFTFRKEDLLDIPDLKRS